MRRFLFFFNHCNAYLRLIKVHMGFLICVRKPRKLFSVQICSIEFLAELLFFFSPKKSRYFDHYGVHVVIGIDVLVFICLQILKGWLLQPSIGCAHVYQLTKWSWCHRIILIQSCLLALSPLIKSCFMMVTMWHYHCL